jgi:hypothetical protein
MLHLILESKLSPVISAAAAGSAAAVGAAVGVNPALAANPGALALVGGTAGAGGSVAGDLINGREVSGSKAIVAAAAGSIIAPAGAAAGNAIENAAGAAPVH